MGMRNQDMRLIVAAVILCSPLLLAGGETTPHGNILDPTGPAAFIDEARTDVGPRTKPLPTFARPWTYTSETSAVVYWHRNQLPKEANSCVEYGESRAYGKKTALTTVARYAHLHRITGLKPDTAYHFRMVMIENGKEIKSEDQTFTTRKQAQAISLPDLEQTYPIQLAKPDTTYVLTQDITTPDTAFVISAPNVTLDLDGHTVTFANESAKQCFGVSIKAKGAVVVCNGVIQQGKAGGDYCACIDSSWRTTPTVVFGIFTDMKNRNGNPVRFRGATANVHVHHNHIMSHVTYLTNRHWPGNSLLWLNPKGDNISVHDNLITEGCHIAIRCAGEGRNVKIYNNDIKHHQQYVNGYAIACATPGMHVFHNRVTSIGRSMHITTQNVSIHDNWLRTKGHMTMSTKGGPAKAQKLMIELHGIKFEEASARNSKVFHNYMHIEQPKPDDKWSYVPCTPLNIGCGADGMNEIYKNAFVGLTHYEKTRMGGYGASGQWATGMIFVSLKGKGASDPSKYVAWIHDNTFTSNHWFIVSKGNRKNTIESNDPKAQPFNVRIENNRFIMVDKPVRAKGRSAFHGISHALAQQVMESNNTSQGMPLTGPTIQERMQEAQAKVDEIRAQLRQAEATLEKLKQEEVLKGKETAEAAGK